MQQNQLVPETCLHAMETCPSVRTARATFLQHLNIAVTPIANSSGDSILRTKHGEFLGPNQTQTTKFLQLNAVLWLASIEFIKCKFKKETPNGVLISNNVKKILLKLSRKDKNNKVLREFEKLSTEVYHIQRPPEN